MVLKIILAVALVGFLVFEIFYLVVAIKRRRKIKQQRTANKSASDDIQESDKGVKDSDRN